MQALFNGQSGEMGAQLPNLLLVAQDQGAVDTGRGGVLVDGGKNLHSFPRKEGVNLLGTRVVSFFSWPFIVFSSHVAPIAVSFSVGL